jgi:hypothetical protein
MNEDCAFFPAAPFPDQINHHGTTGRVSSAYEATDDIDDPILSSVKSELIKGFKRGFQYVPYHFGNNTHAFPLKPYI